MLLHIHNKTGEYWSTDNGNDGEDVEECLFFTGRNGNCYSHCKTF